jgi:HMG (high mobility group) box
VTAEETAQDAPSLQDESKIEHHKELEGSQRVKDTGQKLSERRTTANHRQLQHPYLSAVGRQKTSHGLYVACPGKSAEPMHQAIGRDPSFNNTRPESTYTNPFANLPIPSLNVSSGFPSIREYSGDRFSVREFSNSPNLVKCPIDPYSEHCQPASSATDLVNMKVKMESFNLRAANQFEPVVCHQSLSVARGLTNSVSMKHSVPTPTRRSPNPSQFQPGSTSIPNGELSRVKNEPYRHFLPARSTEKTDSSATLLDPRNGYLPNLDGDKTGGPKGHSDSEIFAEFLAVNLIDNETTLSSFNPSENRKDDRQCNAASILTGFKDQPNVTCSDIESSAAQGTPFNPGEELRRHQLYMQQQYPCYAQYPYAYGQPHQQYQYPAHLPFPNQNSQVPYHPQPNRQMHHLSSAPPHGMKASQQPYGTMQHPSYAQRPAYYYASYQHPQVSGYHPLAHPYYQQRMHPYDRVQPHHQPQKVTVKKEAAKVAKKDTVPTTKKRRTKDPSAPKHPMSAFIFYLCDVRPKYTEKYPGSQVGAISKMIAVAWKELTDAEKAPYIERGNDDKLRYGAEMQHWLSTRMMG